jgi:CRISPR/Cas system Type II protein with McrA/HNH and RuvC-like nuclease domain
LVELAKLLEIKFEEQRGICPYTGEKLIVGKNCSLDHILPRSRFPDLAEDLHNVEWVSEAANHMKWDLTKDEFFAKCALILQHTQGGQCV